MQDVLYVQYSTYSRTQVPLPSFLNLHSVGPGTSSVMNDDLTAATILSIPVQPPRLHGQKACSTNIPSPRCGLGLRHRHLASSESTSQVKEIKAAWLAETVSAVNKSALDSGPSSVPLHQDFAEDRPSVVACAGGEEEAAS